VHTTEFPAELDGLATSLRLAGIETDVEAILTSIMQSLDRWLGAPPPAVLDAWRRRDAIRGERVRWASGEGTAAGIDDSGALLVEVGEGRIALEAGEIHLLR
jgi:biotin-(acetyl-CoA carboxylase) ligase